MKGTVVLRQKAPESLLFEVGIFISLLKQQAREIRLPALYSREARAPQQAGDSRLGTVCRGWQGAAGPRGGPVITPPQMA